MSLIRPVWPEMIRPPIAESSNRLRGLKGFEPTATPALQDPLYADDPTFWILGGDLAAAVANLGHIGIQTPNDRSQVYIVDGFTVGGGVNELFSVDVVSGGAVLLALATDTTVFKRNRRDQQNLGGAPERVGLLRIFDNANAFLGNQVGSIRRAAFDSQSFSFPYRLYSSEQFFVRNVTVNTGITVTMWGRMAAVGAR